MRHDIRQGVKQIMNDDIKPNFSELARRYNSDYRTVKRAYNELLIGRSPIQPKKRPSLLDGYREVIQEKLNNSCSAGSGAKFFR
ncbi:hypothetical protein FEZ51_05395 [Pediococcus stilesii]|uniref:Transposase n=1 Tax=Pediococcus stilesii TaxID=331679 RepID=A0A5R9BUX0_9LACO|nr:hypothetical protein [Pediococcus stilesii]TLQ04496.1 hypothetical protein FEZ51_05395 [Pediococcus stilesii]